MRKDLRFNVRNSEGAFTGSPLLRGELDPWPQPLRAHVLAAAPIPFIIQISHNMSFSLYFIAFHYIYFPSITHICTYISCSILRLEVAVEVKSEWLRIGCVERKRSVPKTMRWRRARDKATLRRRGHVEKQDSATELEPWNMTFKQDFNKNSRRI